MGCILYELASQRKAFSSDWDVYDYIRTNDPVKILFSLSPDPLEAAPLPTDGSCSEVFETVICAMLHCEPTKRPAARHLLVVFNSAYLWSLHTPLPIEKLKAALEGATPPIEQSEEKLRKIREDMESDKREALEAANAKPALELENLKHTHAAEVRLAVDEAITKLRSDHAKETATLAEKHRHELAKASVDMTVLSKAHGAKTSALQDAIAVARNDLRAAEEEIKMTSKFQERLYENKLAAATGAEAEIEHHLKFLDNMVNGRF
jgi:hypothetical protein